MAKRVYNQFIIGIVKQVNFANNDDPHQRKIFQVKYSEGGSEILVNIPFQRPLPGIGVQENPPEEYKEIQKHLGNIIREARDRFLTKLDERRLSVGFKIVFGDEFSLTGHVGPGFEAHGDYGISHTWYHVPLDENEIEYFSRMISGLRC